MHEKRHEKQSRCFAIRSQNGTEIYHRSYELYLKYNNKIIEIYILGEFINFEPYYLNRCHFLLHGASDASCRWPKTRQQVIGIHYYVNEGIKRNRKQGVADVIDSVLQRIIREGEGEDVMIYVEKRNLAIFLSQNVHRRFHKIDQFQCEVNPRRPQDLNEKKESCFNTNVGRDNFFKCLQKNLTTQFEVFYIQLNHKNKDTVI